MMATSQSDARAQPSPTMSAEQRLLLLLARGRLTDSIRARARSLLGQELSWPLLLQQARMYEVTPLLYHHLRQLGFPSVPEAAAAELGTAYRMNAIKNALLARELAALMREFGAAGVPVMPLKGVALAASLYGDPTLRVCADLDILVPRTEVWRAYQVLRAMGYDGAPGEFIWESFQRRLLKTSIEYVLTRRDRGFRYVTELHWGIFLGAPSERAALETLWAEAYATPVFGVKAFQPSPEWAFLCLAVHAARHQWKGLKWLGDIHELCTWTAIDWAKVRCEAKRVGWVRVVELTLSACHTLFETTIPPHFSFRPLPPWVHLFPVDLLYAEPWRDVLAISRLFPSLPAQWRYLLRVLLVPTAAERRLIRLPSALGILYYPLRLSRVAIRHGWRLIVRHRRLPMSARLHS
jgi:Uncharacterised nucleotidyltransferase